MVDRLDLVRDPAALAAHPAAADVEDLDGGFEFVLGDRDQIGVGGVGEHHGALLHGPLERPYVVPQPGGAFVLHLLGGLLHPALQAADVGAGAAGHEVAEFLGEFVVLLGGDPPDTGGRALADVAEQTGAADLGGALEDTGGARPYREDAQHQVDGLADGPGVAVRTEVAHALLLGAAHDLDAGELLVEGHREVRIALVVAVLDVEARVELLDPGVFELERLDLGGDDGPLHGGGGGDHRARPRMEAGQVLEVVGQALAQALGLADVDDPAVLVAELIDPRRVGDLSRLGSIAAGVCHAHHPTDRDRQSPCPDHPRSGTGGAGQRGPAAGRRGRRPGAGTAAGGRGTAAGPGRREPVTLLAGGLPGAGDTCCVPCGRQRGGCGRGAGRLRAGGCGRLWSSVQRRAA